MIRAAKIQPETKQFETNTKMKYRVTHIFTAITNVAQVPSGKCL